jgi:hypothetical protein
MRIKYFAIIIWLMFGTSLLAQAQRDTIFIYDTIRVSVKRPTPPPTNFFEEQTATISKDSIIIDEQSKQSSTMNNLKKSANQLIRKVAVGTMAAVSSISPSVAQTGTLPELSETRVVVDTVVRQIVEVDTTPKKEAPVYLSFAYPLGLYGMDSENYVFNFALSALTGAVGGINGIQIGGIYNQVSGPMRGIQVGGIMNLTEKIEGIQVGGICNFSKDMRGIQVGGIFNQSADVKGIQVGGIANAADKVEGIQVAGIYNAADMLIGIQVGGIANEAKAVHGAQIAGIYNKAEHVRGLQIGFINTTKTLSGTQIGFINKVDTIHRGISIGVLNFFKQDRSHELEISTNTYNTTFLNYRLGGSILHGLIGAGTNWKNRHLELRLGFGNITRLKNNLHLQTSLYRTNSSYYRRNMWLNYQDNWTTLSCGLVYYWGDKIGIKVVPALNYWTDWNRSFANLGSYDFSLDVGLSIKF